MDDFTHLIGGGATGLGVGMWLLKKVIATYESRLDAVEKRVEDKFDKLLQAVLDIRVTLANAAHLHSDVERLTSRVYEIQTKLSQCPKS